MLSVFVTRRVFVNRSPIFFLFRNRDFFTVGLSLQTKRMESRDWLSQYCESGILCFGTPSPSSSPLSQEDDGFVPHFVDNFCTGPIPSSFKDIGLTEEDGEDIGPPSPLPPPKKVGLNRPPVPFKGKGKQAFFRPTHTAAGKRCLPNKSLADNPVEALLRKDGGVKMTRSFLKIVLNELERIDLDLSRTKGKIHSMKHVIGEFLHEQMGDDSDISSCGEEDEDEEEEEEDDDDNGVQSAKRVCI